ncbi:hypothetical protein LCGC14_0761900 [marine sediment metagenome]|uniref:Uncharacterized protein n=1 Tax=marine sediment metagenome TaxID=412755 RepID=A0A0F9Q4X9_9ZZZZ
MHSKKKVLNLLLITGFILVSIFVGLSLYHANKPIFSYNYIEDNFDDQIPGLFPMGWLSAVNPFNVRVVSDSGNRVMEVRGTNSKITEVVRRFKRTSEGVIECKVKANDVQTGFVIHIPQLDREYDPYDDIMIVFLRGGIYVVGGDDIIELDTPPTFWERLILLNDELSWAIDEESLLNSVPVMSYSANFWYSIRIAFTKENFLLTINGNALGTFNYPKYNSPYFASLYFIAIATPINFRFYVDNVKITLIQAVDYIHPGNIALLVIILISAIGFYILYKKKKRGKK